MGENACIRLLGPPKVQSTSSRPIIFPTQRSRNLLFILVLERGCALSREKLFDLLWPHHGPARPRRALNNELWRLKQSLKGGGVNAGDLILCDADTIAFKADADVDVDLFLFDDAAEKAVADGPAASEAALQVERLYTGELLEGIYDDWCLAPREARRARFLEAMETLLRGYVAQRNWNRAIRASRRILAEDPMLEHVHREIMRSYELMGDRAAALRQYEELRSKLKKELGVAPSPETKALRDTIFNSVPARQAPGARAQLSDMVRKDLLAYVDSVADALRETERALQDLTDAIVRRAQQ